MVGRVLFGRAREGATVACADENNLLKMDEQLSESLAFSGRSE